MCSILCKVCGDKVKADEHPLELEHHVHAICFLSDQMKKQKDVEELTGKKATFRWHCHACNNDVSIDEDRYLAWAECPVCGYC